MKIFGFLLIFLLSVSCEQKLGETSVSSLSGKSYRGESIPLGVSLVRDFNQNGDLLNVDLGNHLLVDQGIFYTTTHPLFGEELFFWSRVTQDAHMVEDLNFGGAGSNIRKMKKYGSYIYFFATTATEGTELRRVNINNPYSIETFDFVPGLGMLSVVDADDPALGTTDYNIVGNKLVIYNHYEGLEVADLDTLSFSNITDDNGYSIGDFGSLFGGVELNGRLYLKSFYQSNWKYFILDNALTQLNLLNGSQFNNARSGVANFQVHKNAVFFSGVGTDGNDHLFAHKGSSLDSVELIDFDSRFSVGNTFSSVTKVFATPNYIYMHARNNGGANQYFQISIDTTNFSHSFITLNMSPSDFPIDQLVVGDNYCVNSFHTTGASSRDLVCYRAAQNDVHVIKTNLSLSAPTANADWSGNITSNLSENTNGSSDFDKYGVAGNRLYFLARVGFDGPDADSSGDIYGFELILDSLSLRITSSGGGVFPSSYDVVDTLIVADAGGVPAAYDLVDNILLPAPLQTQLMIGDGISSDSSNPSVIADGQNFLLFIRHDQQLANDPYTYLKEGELNVYDKRNGSVSTIINPIYGTVFYQEDVPGAIEDATIFYDGDTVLIETALEANNIVQKRALLKFNLSTGTHHFIDQYDDTSELDIDKIRSIYKVGSRYLTYVADNDSGRAAFFEIDANNRLLNIATESSSAVTFPQKIGNAVYFPYSSGVEALHAIKTNSSNTGLEIVQVGPSVIFPGGAFWQFMYDGRFAYFEESSSGNQFYYVDINNPANHGYVLDDAGGTVTDQSIIKRGNTLISTNVISASKPLYRVQINGNTPEFLNLGLIGEEKFLNDGTFPIYEQGNDIFRIGNNGESISYISKFTDYTDPACNSLSFPGTGGDQNLAFEKGMLAHRLNGAGADELCFYTINDETINFGAFGYNVSTGLRISKIADEGDFVFIALTKTATNESDLIVIDVLDGSFSILETNSNLKYSPQTFGLKINQDTIYYCDERLYAIDINTQVSQRITESFECDPRTIYVPRSQPGIMLSGIDRENYVGYELYQVRN